MARLFPFRSETTTEAGHPRIVDLEGEDADAVFSALSSTTARRIYVQLDAEPKTPSDIADAIDSSIQNVRYHLENLEEAGLVEVVDTWYSSRGNEMSVYATADGPLIVTSDESRATKLKEALSRFLGGVGVLAGGSLLVQYALTRWLASPEPGGDPQGGDTAGDSQGGDSSGDGSAPTGADGTNDSSGGDMGIADVNGDAANNSTVPDAGNETARNASDGGIDAAQAVFDTIPPGLLFFLGGLAVLLAVTLYWYWSRPTY